MRHKIKSGDRFNRLTVVERSYVRVSPAGSRRSVYDCVCDCGNMTKVDGGNLTGRHPVTSCGCANRETLARVKEFGRTHGMRHTRTYQIWANVVARGRGTEMPEKYYNRGIRVSDRWLKFENFYADMGECPEGMSIDRIDNDGGYFPDNCRYATPTQQARNTRKTWRLIVGGKLVVGADYAEANGIPATVFRVRVKKLGWDVSRAISQPVRKLVTTQK